MSLPWSLSVSCLCLFPYPCVSYEEEDTCVSSHIHPRTRCTSRAPFFLTPRSRSVTEDVSIGCGGQAVTMSGTAANGGLVDPSEMLMLQLDFHWY